MLMLTDDGAFAENLRNPEVCPIESVYQVKVYARDEKGMTGWLPVVGMTKSSRRQESFYLPALLVVLTFRPDFI